MIEVQSVATYARPETLPLTGYQPTTYDWFQVLLRRLHEKQATVGIIGLGYGGLQLDHWLSLKGYRVIGFDIDDQKIAALRRGASYIGHSPGQVVSEMLGNGFEATDAFDRLREPDAIIVC